METRQNNRQNNPDLAADDRKLNPARRTDNPADAQQSLAETAAVKAAEAAAAAAKAEAERVKARDDKSLASTETSASRDAPKDERTPAKITVTFTGDPRGGADPEKPEYGGKFFPKGKAVVVEDVAWIKEHGDNLRKNNHFRVE